jgi:isopropylmalate/homocitrate/citramalate synthase
MGGRVAESVLGKQSGMASISMKLADLGLPTVDDERQAELLKAVKQRGIEKKGLLTDDEFRALVQDAGH